MFGSEMCPLFTIAVTHLGVLYKDGEVDPGEVDDAS